MHRRGTYSIVARDPATGELGVAVHSHWFSVGSVVAWAQPGAGAAATQSVAEVAHGPNTLDLMRGGAPAPDAVAEVLRADALARLRQVGAVDPAGQAAAHTGADCIPCAGHVVGDGFACQANMMARDGVPEAMAEGFAAAREGDLADRLLAALDAAEAAGGDVRGRQSAALKVVPANGESWRWTVDLRVEDHPDPIAELRRLLVLQRAYALAGEADELLGAGETDRAGVLYQRAAAIAPESDELLFWAGLALVQSGRRDDGLDAVRRAVAVNPGWTTLLERLSPELAPSAAEVRQALAA